VRNSLAFTLIMATIGGAAIAAPPPIDPSRDANHAEYEQWQIQRAKKRADAIALLLNLRSDQRAGLERLLAALKPEHGFGVGGPGSDGAKAPRLDTTLPATLDAMQARVDRRDAMAREKIAATRQFYSSLTPDQQRRFDALELLRHDHEHGHRGAKRRLPDGERNGDASSFESTPR